jgi:hypothetical protein
MEDAVLLAEGFISSRRRGDARYYIQSAFSVDDESKMAQEKRPLLAVRDFFRKILIEGDDFEPYQDDDGVVHVGAIDFLLDAPSVLR